MITFSLTTDFLIGLYYISFQNMIFSIKSNPLIIIPINHIKIKITITEKIMKMIKNDLESKKY
jgi:hypothetical protein